MQQRYRLFTALVGLSIFAITDAAFAQVKAEAPKITVGGYLTEVFKVQDRPNNPTQVDRNSTALSADAEIYFNLRSVLDNGLIIGGRVELEASTEADQIDERYLTLERADIGKAEFGSTDRATSKMIYGAPTAIPGYGTIDPTGAIAITLAPSGARTTGNFSKFVGDDAEGINLYTAADRYFGSKAGKGLMLGLSYVPDGCEDFSQATGAAGSNVTGGSGRSCGGGFGRTTDAGQFSNVYHLGANYVESFGVFDVGLYAGYARYAIEANTTSGGATLFQQQGLQAYAFGGMLTYNISGGSAVQVGGLYKNEETGSKNPSTGLGGDKRDVYTAGTRYISNGVNPGSYSLGIDYARSKTDQGNTAGVVTAGRDTYTWVSAGATYQLGPGVLGFAGLGRYEYEDAVAPTAATNNDSKVNFGLLGMRVDF